MLKLRNQLSNDCCSELEKTKIDIFCSLMHFNLSIVMMVSFCVLRLAYIAA